MPASQATERKRRTKARNLEMGEPSRERRFARRAGRPRNAADGVRRRNSTGEGWVVFEALASSSHAGANHEEAKTQEGLSRRAVTRVTPSSSTPTQTKALKP